MSTTVMDSFDAELAPYRSGEGTIRFSLDGRLPVALVKKIVKARLEENAARRHR